MSFTLHEKVGEELILTLYEAHRLRRGVYAQHNVDTGPNSLFIPGKGGKQIPLLLYEGSRVTAAGKGRAHHLRWLFFANLTDRRQSSMHVYQSHVTLHDLYPELYTRQVTDQDAAKLGRLLSKYKIGVPNQSARYWVRTAKTLFGSFQGDPVSLLESCGWTVEGVLAFKASQKIDPLPGYGAKLISLYFTYLAQLGEKEMPDDAFAVDMHVQRIFLQYGAVTLQEDLTNGLFSNVLRSFICGVASRHALKKVDLAHAFWQLGRSLCTSCSRRQGIEFACPIASVCCGNISADNYFKKGKWLLEPELFRKGSDRTLRMPDGPLFEKK